MRPLMWACTCTIVAFIVAPVCISAAWLAANPSAARALADLTAVFAPKECDENGLCNSFDGVVRLGKHFLSKTRHQPSFRAADFPWTETLRSNYEVFRDEYVDYTRSMRVPFHKELGDSQVELAGKVKWRTIPLRLSYSDTDFSKHFPKSMALIRKSGVDAFSVYVHYMARIGEKEPRSPNHPLVRFNYCLYFFSRGCSFSTRLLKGNHSHRTVRTRSLTRAGYDCGATPIRR